MHCATSDRRPAERPCHRASHRSTEHGAPHGRSESARGTGGGGGGGEPACCAACAVDDEVVHPGVGREPLRDAWPDHARHGAMISCRRHRCRYSMSDGQSAVLQQVGHGAARPVILSVAALEWQGTDATNMQSVSSDTREKHVTAGNTRRRVHSLSPIL